MSSEAILTYELTKAGRAEVAIYDGVGRVVKQLLDADLQPGKYTQTITRDDLPAGNYTILISSAEGVATLKFEVIKE
jgi:hypothetical protein